MAKKHIWPLPASGRSRFLTELYLGFWWFKVSLSHQRKKRLSRSVGESRIVMPETVPHCFVLRAGVSQWQSNSILPHGPLGVSVDWFPASFVKWHSNSRVRHVCHHSLVGTLSDLLTRCTKNFISLNSLCCHCCKLQFLYNVDIPWLFTCFIWKDERIF